MPRTVPLLLCGVGALVLGLAYVQWRRGEASRGFTRTEGRVVASEVDEVPGPPEQGYPQYRPRIRYEYSVRGRTYAGGEAAIGSGVATFRDAEDARKEVARFPAGSEVSVFYDAADPRRSVLEPGVPRLVPLVLAGLALLGAGLFLLARR